MRLHESRELELGVSSTHRVGIDGKVYGQLAYGGEAIARLQPAGGNGAFHLVDDLPVEGHAAFQVKLNLHGHRQPPFINVLVYRFTIVLVY